MLSRSAAGRAPATAASKSARASAARSFITLLLEPSCELADPRVAFVEPEEIAEREVGDAVDREDCGAVEPDRERLGGNEPAQERRRNRREAGEAEHLQHPAPRQPELRHPPLQRADELAQLHP